MKKVSLLYLTSSLLIGNLFASEAEVIDGGAIISNRIRASLQNKDAKQLTNEEINRSNPSEYLVRLAIEMILESLRLQEMNKNNQTVDATTALNAGQEMFALGIASFDPSVNKEVDVVEHHEKKEDHLANHEFEKEPLYGGHEVKKNEEKPINPTDQKNEKLVEEIKEKEPESHKSGPVINELDPVINELDEESKQNYEKIKKASFEELEEMKNEIFSDSASKFLKELFEDYKKEPNNFKDTDKAISLLSLCDATSLKFKDIPTEFIESNAHRIVKEICEAAKNDFEFAKLYVKAVSCTKDRMVYNSYDHSNRVREVLGGLDDQQKARLFEAYFEEGVENAYGASGFELLVGELLHNGYKCSENLFKQIKDVVQSPGCIERISKLIDYFTDEQRLDLGEYLIQNKFNETLNFIKLLLNKKITKEQRDHLVEQFIKINNKVNFIESIKVKKQ